MKVQATSNLLSSNSRQWLRNDDDDDDDNRYKRDEAGWNHDCCCSNPYGILAGVVVGLIICAAAIVPVITILLMKSTASTTTTTTTSSTIGVTSVSTILTSTSTSISSSTTTTSSSTSTSSTTSTTQTSTTTSTSTISFSTTSITSSTSTTTTVTTSTTTTAPYCTTRVTFDDIPSQSSTFGIVPNGYKNFNWTNTNYMNALTMPNSGYQTTVSSSPYVAYNAGGNSVSITTANGTRFAFDSVIIAPAWRDNMTWNIQAFTSGITVVNANFLILVFNRTIISCGGCSNWDTMIFTVSGGTPRYGLTQNTTESAFDDLCVSFGY